MQFKVLILAVFASLAAAGPVARDEFAPPSAQLEQRQNCWSIGEGSCSISFNGAGRQTRRLEKQKGKEVAR
jgi:hypothetical protein